MHASLRTLFATTAAIAAVVVLSIVLTLPPAALELGATLPPTLVMGGYHVHTSRSDGTGDVDAIAAAAARAGLTFVIFTDHGDATRTPDAPTYRHGVLCIDAVEVNTASGHVVALGLGSPSPYPLAGPARDVIEDIHRMGGVAVMAHPDSPNPSLRWRGPSAAIDGVEWINVDSEWRDDGLLPLLGTSLHGLIRGPAAVASLFSRPARTFARWDTDAGRNPMFGLAALDAHANIPWRNGQEPRVSRGIRFPPYETLFNALAQVVVLDAPLSRHAPGDAARLLAALTAGHSYSVVRAFADPAALSFWAEQGGRRLTMGDRGTGGGPVTFTASTSGAPGARLALLEGGRTVAQGRGTLRYGSAGAAGVFRVEVSLPGRDMPWLVSNPIVLSEDGQARPDIAGPAPSGEVVPLSTDLSTWTIEREPSSAGAIVQERVGLRFSFTLAPGTPRGQYAALVRSVPDNLGVQHITFTARADRPMRLSVQVRTPDDRGGQRWRRSVYLDATPRTVTVPLEEFDPADAPTTRRPIVAHVQSLLFVVDTLNTLTGASGTVWLSDIGVGTPSLRPDRER